MCSEENYMVSESDIDEKRIEEIDLAELARSFRMLDRFMSSEDIPAAGDVDGDDEKSNDLATKSRLINFLMCSKRCYVERQIALRMIFASILMAPQHLAARERALGFKFTCTEDEWRQE
jgi:hypothetical protein